MFSSSDFIKVRNIFFCYLFPKRQTALDYCQFPCFCLLVETKTLHLDFYWEIKEKLKKRKHTHTHIYMQRAIPQHCARMGTSSCCPNLTFEESAGVEASVYCVFFLLCLGKHLLHVLKCISWLCTAHDREGKIVSRSLWPSSSQFFFSPAQALFIKPLYLSLI